jgi:general secretion pathway protein I
MTDRRKPFFFKEKNQKACVNRRGRFTREAAAERSDASQAGFTLLEVLVAFVIAALAIGALYGGTVSGLDATAVAAKYDEAVSLARSHIAAVGRGEPIALQEHSGAEGEGFTWHLRIRRHGSRVLSLTDQDRANDVKPATAILYDIVVTESWKAGGRERQVTLATRKFDVVQEAASQ